MAPERSDVAALIAVTLLTSGAILGEASLFLAAAVPVAYVGATALSRTPEPSALAVERSFDPEIPAPGERVTVTLAVENRGDRTLPDVRVVDRPPERIPVVGGSPRACLSLRPGESEQISYVVVATQGDHEFETPLARLRSLPAVNARTVEIDPEGGATLRCRRGVTDVPRSQGSLRRVGTQPTDRGGAGLEFHSIREYRRGDPLGRVDWRRLAKGGDLSTVQFRETKATETVIVVDGREAARKARDDGFPTGAELSAYAADRTFAQLLATGNSVGMAALGIDAEAVQTTVPTDRAGRPWVPPGRDAATRTQAGAVLDAVVAAGNRDGAHADGGQNEVALRERLPARADVVLATPLSDNAPVGVTTRLLAAGHDVAIVSPNVAVGDRAGATVARIERRHRVDRLRGTAARVVDWHTDRPLSTALEGMP